MSEGSGDSRLFNLTSRVVAWATVPLYVLGVIAAVWLERQLGLPIELLDVMLSISFGVFAAVGALLVARQPGNVVSWIMAAIGLIVGIFSAFDAYTSYILAHSDQPTAAAVLGAWFYEVYAYPVVALSLVFLPMLFPTGRLLSRRWRWPAAIAGIATAGMTLLGVFRPTMVGDDIPYEIDNPIGIAALTPETSDAIFTWMALALLVGVIAGIISVIVRFRRARGAERQQIKWFVFAASLAPLALWPWSREVMQDIIIGLYLIAQPVAVAIAILRYRLYDIDIIIRRTLIYTILSVMLALLYFGSVVLLQAAVSRATAGRAVDGQSPLVVVVSTLFIAGVFAPLRSRVRGFIDRRFYRRRYDAQKVLAAFARTARDEVEVEALSAEVARVVQETMQPQVALIWLKPVDGKQASLPVS
jgi:hypothetical protein